MRDHSTDRSDPGLVLIDAIFDHIRHLDYALAGIQRVARNLDAVGLERPADDLFEATKGLKESAKAISDAHSGKQSADMSHSNAMTGNLLMLALNTVPRRLAEKKPRAKRVEAKP